MVQTVDAEADRSGREGAPAPGKTVRLTDCGEALVFAQRQLRIVDNIAEDLLDLLRGSHLIFGRRLVSQAALSALIRKHAEIITQSGILPSGEQTHQRFLRSEPGDEAWAREAFQADGAPTRQDETEPTNGTNQESFPSPSQEEG